MRKYSISMMAGGLAFLVLSSATTAFAFPKGSQIDSVSTPRNSGIHRVIAEDISVGAKDFIKKMSDRGLSFLSNKDLSQEAREKEFRQLLQESFDMKTIGRFALGRYWKTSDKKALDEYLKLFENMIVEVYSRRFSEYDGQTLEIGNTRLEENSDAIVTTFIVPKEGPKVQVDWRVRNKKGKYQVVDVIVEGVSMSLTQRSDFASVIQRGGGDIEVLLAHLRTGQ